MEAGTPIFRSVLLGNEERADDETVREILQAAYPHLVADIRKGALSKEALQAAADALCLDTPANASERNEVRIEIEAAFDALPDTPEVEKLPAQKNAEGGLSKFGLAKRLEATSQHSVLVELAEELKRLADRCVEQAEKFKQEHPEYPNWAAGEWGAEEAFREAAQKLREKASKLPSEGREGHQYKADSERIAYLLSAVHRGERRLRLIAEDNVRVIEERRAVETKAQRYEEALKAADDFAATALKQDTAQEWHTDVRSLREVIAIALQDGGEDRG